MKVRTGVLALALAGAVSLGGVVSYGVYRRIETAHQERVLLDRKRLAWERLKGMLWEEIRHFDGQASVLVEDLETGWKTGYRQEEKFPAASLVKIPVMTACYQAAEERRIKLSDQLVLKASDRAGGSGVLKTKPAGGAYSIQQLIDLMVTESDNTAANMLINHLGFDYLNKSFRKQGLASTVLVRKMMDFSNRNRGVENYTTAGDVASVLRRLYSFRMVNSRVSEKCLELLIQQKIKDRIPAGLPLETLVAHKTGLEDGVCHDSGIVFTGEGNYMITVLTKHNAKTNQKAKRFIAKLASLTYQYMTES